MNTTAKEIRVFQSTAKGAANKKYRFLAELRNGKRSYEEVIANQKYDVELGKIMTVAEIDAAARGEGRKRRGDGVSNTESSAASKASKLRSNFRAGKLSKEELTEIWNKDTLLASKFTLESLTAPARFTVVSIEVPATNQDDSNGQVEDEDEDEDEEDDDSDDE